MPQLINILGKDLNHQLDQLDTSLFQTCTGKKYQVLSFPFRDSETMRGWGCRSREETGDVPDVSHSSLAPNKMLAAMNNIHQFILELLLFQKPSV